MGRILIFEHTSVLGYKMKRILEQSGFQDVELIKDYSGTNQNRPGQRPQLVIVDLDNRKQDMIQLIRKIKKDTYNAPVISISGASDLSTLKKAIGAGCREFVLKPFESETLISKVYKVYYEDQKMDEKNESFKLGEFFKGNAITLKWSDDFAIGIEQIDSEHKQIFEHFNRLYSMMREGCGHEYYQELLGFLADYVNTHFEHEEQYQLGASFQECHKHKEYHDNFRAHINEIMESHKGQAISDNDLISISLFIKDWLIHHILLEDMKLKETVKFI